MSGVDFVLINSEGHFTNSDSNCARIVFGEIHLGALLLRLNKKMQLSCLSSIVSRQLA